MRCQANLALLGEAREAFSQSAVDGRNPTDCQSRGAWRLKSCLLTLPSLPLKSTCLWRNLNKYLLKESTQFLDCTQHPGPMVKARRLEVLRYLSSPHKHRHRQ